GRTAGAGFGRGGFCGNRATLLTVSQARSGWGAEREAFVDQLPDPRIAGQSFTHASRPDNRPFEAGGWLQARGYPFWGTGVCARGAPFIRGLSHGSLGWTASCRCPFSSFPAHTLGCGHALRPAAGRAPGLSGL